jgi:cytochrome c biogenesis protein CcdA/thiol-disulfide isomerase/thioredoxin
VALLILVGFLGGLVTGISPCIIPVVPVIFAAGAVGATPKTARSGRGRAGATRSGRPGGAVEAEPVAGPEELLSVGAGSGVAVVERSAGGGIPPEEPVADPDDGQRPAAGEPAVTPDPEEVRRLRRHPYAVVGGLVLSFSVTTLVGATVLSALGLPLDLLRKLGLVILTLVAVGLIVPTFGDLLERPFARLVGGRQHDQGGGFVLGLSLGLLFVPCAGPVLAAIAAVGASHRIGASAIVLTVAFAVGVAVPLLVFAMAGQRLAGRMKVFRTRAAVIRKVIGVLMLVVALAVWLNLTSGLQKALPGYTDALTNHLEANASATSALRSVRGETGEGALGDCTPASPVLARCGEAPAFAGITQWLNTPGDRPLTLAGLKGRVVLVDFWTYTCINCERTLPHLEAWNRAYAADGLTIVGVHTPEFAFEHVVSNVTEAAGQLGVTYPVAIDDAYATWNAYQNNYWPAEYLIDADGVVRHVDFGEGEYTQTESFIRQLLVAADPSVQLPPRTDVPDATPTEPTTPESYLGAGHPTDLDGQTIEEGQAATYTAPSPVAQDEYAYNGRWEIGDEASTAVSGASIDLQYQAKDVYLVLSGEGSVTVSVNGVRQKVVPVSGEPKLYQLVGTPQSANGLLQVALTPGLSAYDFTFG